ncbi:MAG TPA: translocation/assembly module TamB domain-containing protein [Polyangiaceae bacterium]|nr:translocation/assembly module TamB domain-containing protein [Polyangiaceae bacterium]
MDARAPVERRWEPGRWVARALCAVFAVIGALPLLAAAALSSGPLTRWAERETARVLRQELGVSATYKVELRLLPLRLAVVNLRVPAKDGGPPALVAESVTVAPRVFALFGGRLDLGEIEIKRPEARLVVRDGKVTNVAYRLPERASSGAAAKRAQRAPFTALSITEGHFHLDVDGTAVDTGAVDLDVFADSGPSFEISLTADETRVQRKRIDRTLHVATSGHEVSDDDLLCRLEARVHVQPESFDVRRLSLLAGLDDTPGPGRHGGCEAVNESNPLELAARVSQLHATLRKDKAPIFTGHLVVRAPLLALNRFVPTLPLHGFLAFAGDVRNDGSFKLPEAEGKLTGKDLGLGGYRLAKDLSVEVRMAEDKIDIPHYEMGFADGRVTLANVHIEPLRSGVPMTVEAMDETGVPFTSLMRDLDVTPRTIVSWDIHETHARKVHGTLAPLHVEGELTGDTRDFEVFDRSWKDPARKHMIGVKHATLRGRFRVVPHALEFFDTRTDFGKSSVLVKLVSIGFDNRIQLDIAKDSRIDLADASPLVDIPMSGVAELDVDMAGMMSDPLLTGNVKIGSFVFGGFPIGDLKSGKVRFRPLYLELTDIEAQKGKSTFSVPNGRIDFDAGATLVVDARMKSQSFDLRDFLAIWHFDDDPRWADLEGETAADVSVHYVLGGKEDACQSGVLVTNGSLAFKRLALFGERYDGGHADYRMRWYDRDAGYRALELGVPSLVLNKGPGSIVGSLDVRPGGKIEGHLVASEVPIGKIDALPSLLKVADGQASAVAELSGTIDDLEAVATARLSPVRVGRATLPASSLAVELTPIHVTRPTIGKTHCGAAIETPFDRAEYEADAASGVFTVRGSLFGGQMTIADMHVTRQRAKIVRGKVELKDLDLGAAAELVPALALSESPPDGRLSGTLDMGDVRTADPLASRVRLTLDSLALGRNGYTLKLAPGAEPVELENGAVRAPALAFTATTPSGHQVTFDLSGGIASLRDAPRIDANVALRPVDLGALTQLFPRVERAKGSVTGHLGVSGPLRSPEYSGGFALSGGEVVLRGLTVPLSDIDVALKLDGGELEVSRGSARMGNGKITLGGGAPLRGFELGAVRLDIAARDLALPLGDGVRASADADLLATWKPSIGERALPRLSGNVNLRSFEYKRPVTMTAELQSLGRRGKRTSFEEYDPADDVVALDVTIKSSRPLQIKNELIEADLDLGNEGVVLSGTNGRYGLRGTVEVKPGGRIKLRRNVFDINQGTVRFDDATRIAPNVDVTATTDYRRYAAAGAGTTGSSPAAPTAAASAGTSVAGGHWTIRMHAHGDADDLKIDLTSDPALAQDDIFLLITVGLTRAELDQAQSAAVGESVALEALGTLSGADRAVTDAVPVIDEFRFGSEYSSRTGRTEPTVTIGKRLTERLRANVTTGLAESREVRSNVEWRLNNRVSVETTYDNVNDISSSALGNLGADVRWRLEFE